MYNLNYDAWYIESNIQLRLRVKWLAKNSGSFEEITSEWNGVVHWKSMDTTFLAEQNPKKVYNRIEEEWGLNGKWQKMKVCPLIMVEEGNWTHIWVHRVCFFHNTGLWMSEEMENHWIIGNWLSKAWMQQVPGFSASSIWFLCFGLFTILQSSLLYGGSTQILCNVLVQSAFTCFPF